MEQQILKCPKCGTEIGEVEFYKYHRRCKDCWNAYCKTKRYNNPEVNKRAMQKYKAAHPITERYCKCCKVTKPIEQFDHRKHYCKECYRTPQEIKNAYNIERKEQLKIAKAKWYENNKEVQREKHRAAYRAKVGEKKTKTDNKELKAIRQKKWYEAHKEAEQQKQKERYNGTFVKVEKPIKVKEIKPPKVNRRKLTQTDANERKVKVKIEKTIKPKKEKTIKLPKPEKVSRVRIETPPELRMSETRVYPKVRDVRRGWDKTIAELKLKFQTV